MTEKEKMQKQMLYDANYYRDLLSKRTSAKELCYQYNQLHPLDEQGQQKIMHQLLGKIISSQILII
jgi:maltose O-acetyltransferase